MILNLRAGEWVEVRSASEIAETLDGEAALDRMPFMPEMLQYCGRRFRVFKRADKACDTITGRWVTRRLNDSVFLEDMRCDGSVHGGCQALCSVFWKEAWLKRVDGPAPAGMAAADVPADIRVRLEYAAGGPPHRETYRCQATELVNATTPLSKWDIRQYLRDIRSGNISVGHFVVWFSVLLFNAVQRRLGGRTYPDVKGRLVQTPTAALHLRPGEIVRVKPKEEIVKTLDARSCNRGLSFDVEMVRYCGTMLRVVARADRIVDEKTGRLIRLPSDCIVLEGATCRGNLSTGRIFCQRNIYAFWREIWLERVDS
ncbi:MAG: hypothetical protein AB7I50_26725 [Vicinamibacterales bacterium]